MALPMSLAGGGARPRPGRRTASCHTVPVRGRVLNRPRSIPVGVAFDGTNIWATNARLGQRVEDRAVSERPLTTSPTQDHSPTKAAQDSNPAGHRARTAIATENTAWTVSDRRLRNVRVAPSIGTYAALDWLHLPVRAAAADRLRCDYERLSPSFRRSEVQISSGLGADCRSDGGVMFRRIRT